LVGFSEQPGSILQLLDLSITGNSENANYFYFLEITFNQRGLLSRVPGLGKGNLFEPILMSRFLIGLRTDIRTNITHYKIEEQ